MNRRLVFTLILIILAVSLLGVGVFQITRPYYLVARQSGQTWQLGIVQESDNSFRLLKEGLPEINGAFLSGSGTVNYYVGGATNNTLKTFDLWEKQDRNGTPGINPSSTAAGPYFYPVLNNDSSLNPEFRSLLFDFKGFSWAMWTPDQKSIIFLLGGEVKLYNPETKSVFDPGIKGRLQGVAFSPDSKKAAVVCSNAQSYFIYDLDLKNMLLLRRFDYSGQVVQVSWNQQGREIYITIKDHVYNCYLVDPQKEGNTGLLYQSESSAKAFASELGDGVFHYAMAYSIGLYYSLAGMVLLIAAFVLFIPRRKKKTKHVDGGTTDLLDTGSVASTELIVDETRALYKGEQRTQRTSSDHKNPGIETELLTTGLLETMSLEETGLLEEEGE